MLSSVVVDLGPTSSQQPIAIHLHDYGSWRYLRRLLAQKVAKLAKNYPKARIWQGIFKIYVRCKLQGMDERWIKTTEEEW